MRSSKSRSRGKSNRNRPSGNNINRVFDSSGPEGKVRGTPQQIIDKYTQLARDAFLGNDRVAAENFQQHAEHYTRLLGEAQRDAEARRVQADAANRERQMRERDEREEREARPDAQREGSETIEADQPGARTSGVADVIGDEPGDSGLVDTPESKPRKRTPRPRKPRMPKPEENAASSPETPEAAE
jgi:hypothetical protein